MVELHQIWGRELPHYTSSYTFEAALIRVRSDRRSENILRARAEKSIREIADFALKDVPSQSDTPEGLISIRKLQSVLELTQSPNTFRLLAHPPLISGCIKLMALVKKSGNTSPLSYEYGYLCLRIISIVSGVCLLYRSQILDRVISAMLSEPRKAILQILSKFVAWELDMSFELMDDGNLEPFDVVLGWRGVDGMPSWSILVQRSEVELLSDLLWADRKCFMSAMATTYMPCLPAILFIIWRHWHLKWIRYQDMDEAPIIGLRDIIMRYWLTAPEDQEHLLGQMQGASHDVFHRPWRTERLDVEDCRIIINAYMTRFTSSGSAPYAPLHLGMLPIFLEFVKSYVSPGVEDLLPQVFGLTVGHVYDWLLHKSVPAGQNSYRLDESGQMRLLKDTFLSLSQYFQHVEHASNNVMGKVIRNLRENDFVELTAMMLLLPPLSKEVDPESAANASLIYSMEVFYEEVYQSIPKALVLREFHDIFPKWLQCSLQLRFQELSASNEMERACFSSRLKIWTRIPILLHLEQNAQCFEVGISHSWLVPNAVPYIAALGARIVTGDMEAGKRLTLPTARIAPKKNQPYRDHAGEELNRIVVHAFPILGWGTVLVVLFVQEPKKRVPKNLMKLHQGIKAVHTPMTRTLAASTLLFALSAYALPSPAAHNPNNPNRHLLSRAITTDTSLVDGKTFDFVIVGGGTAGLAIAARLTESSNITVAVIEAGGDGSAHADNITIPGYSYLNGLSGSDADWSYTITNQSSAGNRATKWPRGKVLGGSGSTNGMFWGIGAQQDWDAWSTLFPTSSSSYNTSTLPNGTPASFAWNWKNIQSYFKKCETFHAPPVEQQNQFGMTIDPGSHGTKGPIQTTMSQWIFEPIANWVPTLVNVGMKKGDLSTGNTNVASITPSTLNPTNFTRSNSLAGYITPAGPRSNLVILTGFQATGLVWGTSKTSNNAVATGVNFAASANSQTFSVKAAKEVILSGGVIGSAQLLQLSGVGPKALTDSLNIKSVVDLPGVGQNLQDHEATSMTWAVDGQTWFDLMVNPTLQAEQLAQWRESGTGMWTYINEAVAYPNIQDVMGTAASTWISSVSSQLSSALTSLGQQQSLDATVLKGITEQFKIQLEMLQNGVGQLEIIMTMLAGQGNAGIQFAQQHAWSRGELKITSASAFDYPTINPNYFSNGWDVDIMNAGLRFVRRVGGTAPMSAYLKTENAGTSALTTDEAINAYLPNVIATGYHPIGTCSMLPLDMGGVVDTTLRVYGTANVRVIDASVMPIHVTAHTMAPAYAIAEYGADIIKMAYWPIPASSTSTAAGGSGTGGAGSGNASTESSGLSSNQRTIVIATTIGAAAVAAILGLLFFIRRRKANKQAAEDPHRPSVGGHNRTLSILQPYTDNPRSAVPMQTLSQSDLNAPIMPFKGGSKESYRMSASTMDTAQLHAATPMHEHQSLHYDGPHTPGYAYNSQGEFNPYAGSNAPGTPHMGPAPGLAPGNGHEYAPVSGRASPASGPRI